jgi:ABC-type dipeptide/oligopeptide/nickel transport system permease component
LKRYLLKRAVEAILTLVALTLVVFLSAHATGNPARYLMPPEVSNPAELERLERLLGLDRSLVEQFGLFLANAAQGNLGTSFIHNRPVLDMLLERLPATFELAATAVVAAVLIGVPLGVVAAVRRGSIIDRLVTATAILSMSVPTFWVGIMLIVLFATQLRWLPAFGRGEPAELILPAATLTLAILAGMVRLTRSSMLEILESDFIKFARMKGLSKARVTWKHALKNALLPVITFTGITLGQAFNGVTVVENVFAWPGLGRLTLDAVVERDFPLLQGAVLFGGFFFIVSAFAVDLAYAYIDPRIREQHTG